MDKNKLIDLIQDAFLKFVDYEDAFEKSKHVDGEEFHKIALEVKDKEKQYTEAHDLVKEIKASFKNSNREEVWNKFILDFYNYKNQAEYYLYFLIA